MILTVGVNVTRDTQRKAIAALMAVENALFDYLESRYEETERKYNNLFKRIYELNRRIKREG